MAGAFAVEASFHLCSQTESSLAKVDGEGGSGPCEVTTSSSAASWEDSLFQPSSLRCPEMNRLLWSAAPSLPREHQCEQPTESYKGSQV